MSTELRPSEGAPEVTPEAPAGAPEISREEARRHSAAGKRGLSFGVMDVVWFIPRMLSRIVCPKLVDRYVMGELLGPLAFGWVLFIVLFVFSLNLFKLAQMAARGAPLPIIGEMVWLRVVLSSVICLPMAMLLSGLLAFGRLSGDSELIAVQAGGVPNTRPVRNAFILGLALSLAGLALNEYVIPPAGRRFHFLEDKVKALLKGQVLEGLTDKKAFIIQDMDHGRVSRIVIAKQFEDAEAGRPAEMRDVTYIQYDDKGQWNTIVSAERAQWAEGSQWRFFNSDTQFRHTMTKQRLLFWHANSQLLTLKKTPRQVATELKEADDMSYRELRAYIQDLKKQKVKGRTIRELTVDMERKLSVPFAAVVLALIGAPLGIRRQRSTAGVGIGLSLLIIIMYYMGMSFLGVLGENGQIQPIWAAWGCNLAGIVVGLWLTLRSSS